MQRLGQGYEWISYNASKSAVLQMARSMAAELGAKGIRVNSISPGSIGTKWVLASPHSPCFEYTCLEGVDEPRRLRRMTNGLLVSPEVEKLWAGQNPLGRIADPHELRGVAVWLASDASSFCTGSE